MGLQPALGSILDRYLVGGFLRIFCLSLVGMTALYLLVDFFDRFDNFLRAGASLRSSIAYFLFKLPLSASRTFGFAALFATLFALGMLARNREIIAMRSSGLSLKRIALPLLLFSLALAPLMFFWNESLVPLFTRKAQDIYRTEVKKKPKTLTGSEDIWLRGKGSFIRVGRFDSKKKILEGVSVYFVTPDFALRGVIEAPSARWNGNRWETDRGTEWLFLPDGRVTPRKTPLILPLTETPADFELLKQDPEELGFFDLRNRIADLKAKGIDTTEYQVDLHLKLALPFVPALLVVLAIPFALRHGPGGGLVTSFSLTLLIGFGYWFFLAFSRSLGHSGALPPWISAWLPNLTLALAVTFFTSFED